VVDALLAEVRDKVAHRVEVKLAAAKVAFNSRFAAAEVRAVVEQLVPDFDEAEEATAKCPACGSVGVARGEHDVDGSYEYDEDDDSFSGGSWVTFTPTSFACRYCALKLTSAAEVVAAGLDDQWVLEGLDPADFVDYDSAYDAWRDSLHE
jgi:hypothetical protein